MKNAFAQTAEAAAGSGSAGTAFMLQMLGLFFIIFVFYLLFIRPQKRKEEERRQMINRLAKNDNVITIGGLKGKVVGLGEHEITLEIDSKSNTRVRVLRSAVSSIETGSGNESK